MDSAEPSHDWYLRDWCDQLGIKQSHLAQKTDWSKGRTWYIWHGETQYTREIVDAVARALSVEPYELFMPPAEALAIRRLRETARVIVAEDRERASAKKKPAKAKSGSKRATA